MNDQEVGGNAPLQALERAKEGMCPDPEIFA